MITGIIDLLIDKIDTIVRINVPVYVRLLLSSVFSEKGIRTFRSFLALALGL